MLTSVGKCLNVPIRRSSLDLSDKMENSFRLFLLSAFKIKANQVNYILSTLYVEKVCKIYGV